MFLLNTYNNFILSISWNRFLLVHVSLSLVMIRKGMIENMHEQKAVRRNGEN